MTAGIAIRTETVTPDIVGALDAADPVAALLGALPADGLSAARADAAARLRAQGLPRARDEYWRYTDPRPFLDPNPAPIPLEDRAPDAPLFEDLPRLRIVLTDGAFDAAASDPLALAGAEIATLGAGGADWAAALYGTLEAAGQRPVPRPFAALNTAVARDGVLIRVTGTPDRPVHIQHRRSALGADVIWHHVIRIEPGATLTLLETGMVGARSNGVIEADIGAGGTLHHITAKRAAPRKMGLTHLFARVATGAVLKSFTLSVNGTVMRHEAVIDMVGDDAVAHVAGAVLGDGARGDFHHDDTVFVTHGALRGESRQVFKKVLKNGARGVFQGKILVRPGAQKTDGYQISQALLLDEDSQFLAKPELEIYADDVKCSHGSTTGALDPEAMFYLRSRGIPRERAVVFLVLSFLADALDEIEDAGLRGQIADRLEAWLVRRARS